MAVNVTTALVLTPATKILPDKELPKDKLDPTRRVISSFEIEILVILDPIGGLMIARRVLEGVAPMTTLPPAAGLDFE